MNELLSAEHVGALAVIAVTTAVLVVLARNRPGWWPRGLALVLVADELSWWVFMAAGGGEPGQRAQPLPLQLCDMAILIAAAALWTRQRMLVAITYFWGLAGTLQALLTPDLAAQHFPGYPYFQYYIAHGGVVAAALVLVAGMRLHPSPRAASQVALLTIAYAGLVGLVDAVTGADYMYLRSKPAGPTLLDLLGPWPVYVLVGALLGVVLLMILDAPFRIGRTVRPGRPAPETHG